MIRVLIADDHPILRQGVRQILSDTADVTVAAEAGSGPELLAAARATPADVVVMDISMPGATGLDLLRQLKIEKPALPVLVLSVHSEQEYAVRALKAGASGYLTKGSAPNELVAAIRRVAGGGRYLTETLAERLADEVQAPAKGKLPHEMLSDREHEVFLLIARGKTPREIAQKMSLSPKTVSTYRARILEKMSLKNNAELMHYAFENGLVDA